MMLQRLGHDMSIKICIAPCACIVDTALHAACMMTNMDVKGESNIPAVSTSNKENLIFYLKYIVIIICVLFKLFIRVGRIVHSEFLRLK